METDHYHHGNRPGASLETFLVEWKPVSATAIGGAIAALETFLVEWKR